jgi:NADPH:quinone reductase-like Zn-dependent oxidoreductase
MAGGGGNIMAGRSGEKPRLARALWYAGPGVAELREAPLPAPAAGEARVRTLYSGISRGTERLVFQGAVGRSEWQRMRCPMQEGDFPFPVKYGYCAVGLVEEGPADLVGRTVFCLHPHQDVFHAPADLLAVVPGQVPPRRATLAANMETALNALWDGGAGPGDSVVVVGAGVVGLLVASLAARLPGATVTIVDEAAGSSIGLIAYGTTHHAVVEARDLLREKGVVVDYLRLRALPLAPSIAEFVHRHERVYVIEQNRDGQMYDLLRLDLPAELAGRLRSIRHYDGQPIPAEAITRPLLELEEAVPVQ